MRSFVCRGVSSTVCARLGGASTSIPSRVTATKHDDRAPSLAGCIPFSFPQLIIQPVSVCKSVISRRARLRRGRRLGTHRSHRRTGEKRHKEEKGGIRGNVKIEINETMHQNAATTGEAGEPQSRCERNIRFLQRAQAGKEKQTDKPGATQSSDNPCFGKRFKVVVMSMIDDLSIVKSLIGWIDGSKCAKSCAKKRMIQKNAPRPVTHRSPFVLLNFQRLQAAEPRKDLLDAEPRNQRQRRNEHNSAC